MDNDWNGLADLFANLITKYAGVLDLDNLPDPMPVDSNIENEDILTWQKHRLRKRNKSAIIYLRYKSKLF